MFSSFFNHERAVAVRSSSKLNRMDEIIGGVFGVIAVQTGRVIVWLVSFDKWRGEPLFGEEGRIYGAAGALSFVRDGKRVITETGLLFVGAVFYVVLLAIIIALFTMA
jgi:hypothetical protein